MLRRDSAIVNGRAGHDGSSGFAVSSQNAFIGGNEGNLGHGSSREVFRSVYSGRGAGLAKRPGDDVRPVRSETGEDGAKRRTSKRLTTMSPGPNPIYRIGLDVCCNTGAEAQLNGHRWNNVRRMDAQWKAMPRKDCAAENGGSNPEPRVRRDQRAANCSFVPGNTTGTTKFWEK